MIHRFEDDDISKRISNERHFTFDKYISSYTINSDTPTAMIHRFEDDDEYKTRLNYTLVNLLNYSYRIDNLKNVGGILTHRNDILQVKIMIPTYPPSTIIHISQIKDYDWFDAFT